MAKASSSAIVHGEGPGVTVLLHAAGSGPRALDRLAQRLVPAAGRTVALAIEDAGHTVFGDGDRPFATAVGLVRNELEQAAEGKRFIFGHSMGGLVGLLALLDGVPVDAAVLYEPIVLSLLDADDAGDRAALDWDRAVIAAFQAAMADGDVERGVRGFIEAYGEMAWEALPGPARAELVGKADLLLTQARTTNAATVTPPMLERVRVPVLVLAGAKSPDVTRRMARRLSERLANGHLAVLTDAGHMGPIAAAGAVAEQTGAFLQRHCGRMPPL